MGTETLSLSELVPASPDEIFSAWMDSEAHSAITGEEAEVQPFVGGRHSAFGGYATGQTVALDPGRRILMTWRSTEFPDESPDSRVEVTLDETLGGTLVTILHTEIPSGQSDRYRVSWLRSYLEPLRRFFTERRDAPETDSPTMGIKGPRTQVRGGVVIVDLSAPMDIVSAARRATDKDRKAAASRAAKRQPQRSKAKAAKTPARRPAQNRTAVGKTASVRKRTMTLAATKGGAKASKRGAATKALATKAAAKKAAVKKRVGKKATAKKPVKKNSR